MQKTERYYLRKKGQIPSANQVTKRKVMKTKFYILIPHAGERGRNVSNLKNMIYTPKLNKEK